MAQDVKTMLFVDVGRRQNDNNKVITTLTSCDGDGKLVIEVMTSYLEE